MAAGVLVLLCGRRGRRRRRRNRISRRCRDRICWRRRRSWRRCRNRVSRRRRGLRSWFWSRCRGCRFGRSGRRRCRRRRGALTEYIIADNGKHDHDGCDQHAVAASTRLHDAAAGLILAQWRRSRRGVRVRVDWVDHIAFSVVLDQRQRNDGAMVQSYTRIQPLTSLVRSPQSTRVTVYPSLRSNSTSP